MRCRECGKELTDENDVFVLDNLVVCEGCHEAAMSAEYFDALWQEIDEARERTRDTNFDPIHIADEIATENEIAAELV